MKSTPAKRSRQRYGLGALLVAVMASAFAPFALAAETNPTAALAAQIDAQIGQPRYASADWGIAVMSLDTGRSLYTHNADRLLQPASTAKLFTAALALDTLGTEYRIPTQLLGNPHIKNGRLDGPLLLYGMGDPTLGSTGTNTDWADQLATQLAATGVRRVRGDLIADDSYFASPLIGSGWEASDMQSWFAVPSSALSVQENVVTLNVQPGKSEGAAAQLDFDPAGALPQTINNLTTSARNTHSDINIYRAPGDTTLYTFGNIPQRNEAQTFKLAMVDPAQFAGEQLRQALSRHGITVEGKLRVLHWPQHDEAWRTNDAVLAQVLSPPVMEILKRGLKRSQNLYLQNLLLISGIKAQATDALSGNGSPGFITSEAWGIRAMHRLLDGIGISATSSQLEEGAGLSRQDLTTPNAMVLLLTYLAKQPYVEPLREALPIAGIDGTLEWRMRNTPAANNVHAKTGSMSYVHCMAGYVTTAAGEHVAFAIMLNNYARSEDEPSASHDLDAIAVLLAAFLGHS